MASHEVVIQLCCQTPGKPVQSVLIETFLYGLVGNGRATDFNDDNVAFPWPCVVVVIGSRRIGRRRRGGSNLNDPSHRMDSQPCQTKENVAKTPPSAHHVLKRPATGKYGGKETWTVFGVWFVAHTIAIIAIHCQFLCDYHRTGTGQLSYRYRKDPTREGNQRCALSGSAMAMAFTRTPHECCIILTLLPYLP